MVSNATKKVAGGNGSSSGLRYDLQMFAGKGIHSIDNTAIAHSSVGDFTYNPKTGAVSKMKGEDMDKPILIS